MTNSGISLILFGLLSLSFGSLIPLKDDSKDNGDIFIINYDSSDSFDGDVDDIPTTTQTPREEGYIDFDEIEHICNMSFIIPISTIVQFNTTGDLPDEKDKTVMCFLRCYYETSGLFDNFKFNMDLVRKHMWPATGDSIQQCELEKINEDNACVRAYAIIKCAMIRALTDARNKPMV